MRAVRPDLARIGLGGAAGLSFASTQALAHASERGHVLLLPTGYYLWGGTLAVAASVLVLALVRSRDVQAYSALRLDLGPFPRGGRRLISAASFAAAMLLIAAGFLGSPDPLLNPLPTVFWTLLWVGLTLLHGLFGDLWRWLDPWQAPYRWLTGERPAPLSLPGWLQCWPAVVLLCYFAWFELVDPAPEDPRRLAAVLAAYWLLTFIGCLLFGHENWCGRCEFLGVFFRFISRFAILDSPPGTQRRIALCLPGAQIARADPLPPAGVVFLLVALGSVSFDGLSRTFAWLAAIGVNPLDFPGRSAVLAANTLGLSLVAAALVAAFAIAVWLGELIAGSHRIAQACGQLVWSIVPIALAYHFAHYLTALLVDGQYALIALSDPFSRGWNLLGLTGRHAAAGVIMGHEAAWAIWNIQAAAIVSGHVLAVLLAHLLALRLHAAAPRAVVSQLPLALLMIGYTLFGLWLLSTPSIG